MKAALLAMARRDVITKEEDVTAILVSDKAIFAMAKATSELHGRTIFHKLLPFTLKIRRTLR